MGFLDSLFSELTSKYAPVRNSQIDPRARLPTRNCTFEPVLGGAQGDQVTKAFEAVLNG
jgi:hypothetical protein